MKHKKDAYYFPHDSNAKDDPKCVLLIEQLGLEGYGIYWVLVETLREQPNFSYPISLIPALARRYNTSSEKMGAVVLKYNLFVVDDDTFFYSPSLVQRMKFYLDKKAKLSEAGKRGNEKRWGKKNIALQSGSDQVAIANKTNKNKTENNLFFEEIGEGEFKVPNDNVGRNFDALKRRLSEYKIDERYYLKIFEMTNYGEVGHAIWKFLDAIRDRTDASKIKDPTAYLIKCLGIESP